MHQLVAALGLKLSLLHGAASNTHAFGYPGPDVPSSERGECQF